MKLLLFITMFSVIGCKNCGKYIYKDYKITKIFMCSQPTTDLFWGSVSGKCRVKLEDGTRMTVESPIAVGDTIRKLIFIPNGQCN